VQIVVRGNAETTDGFRPEHLKSIGNADGGVTGSRNPKVQRPGARDRLMPAFGFGLGMPADRAIVDAEGHKRDNRVQFFSGSARLSVAEIAALTGAEPCEGADLSRR
jgi:hypothetical protein